MECLDGILTSLLEDDIQVWAMKSQSEHTQVNTLLDKIDAASEQPVPAVLRATTSLKSPTLYIFTSGTTGECDIFIYFFNRSVRSDILNLIVNFSISTAHTNNTRLCFIIWEFEFMEKNPQIEDAMSCKWCLVYNVKC